MRTHEIRQGITKPLQYVGYGKDDTTVDRWLEEYMQRSEAVWTESDDLYAHYRLHAENPVSHISFGRRLGKLGVQNYRSAAGRGWGIVEKEEQG